MRTETEIKKFIIEEFVPDIAIDDLDSDLNLVDTGMIDSLGVLKIVSALEFELDMVIEPEDLDIDNFQTVNAIHKIVQRKALELA